MKLEKWKTYRTRFLVQAKQINYALTFVDHLGRQHCGRKGDYLVESCDGVLSIAPRRIFEDVYVPMIEEAAGARNGDAVSDKQETEDPKFAPLVIEEIPLDKPSPQIIETLAAKKAVGDTARKAPARTGEERTGEERTGNGRPSGARADDSVRVRSRKLPQPCSGRPSGTRVSLM